MGKRTYLHGQKPLQIILLNNTNDYIYLIKIIVVLATQKNHYTHARGQNFCANFVPLAYNNRSYC